MELAREKLLEIYRNMVRSRAFEELVIELMPQWKIPASWMSGVGQEGVVGALSTLREDDYVTYTHRGCYYFITRGSDPGRILAELYGKRTGYCGGKGGRHLADTANKLFGKSGTIGGHAPLAVGMATAAQIRGDDAVVMSFFGDGASNRGTTHESMNLSAVWKLPVVWVCENNAWAGTTPVSLGTAVTDIANLAGSYAGKDPPSSSSRPTGSGSSPRRDPSRPAIAIPKRSRPGSGGTRSIASVPSCWTAAC
jgi:TPP-dependent pyruvate/acetoin dehydrogenase alpha subunit